MIGPTIGTSGVRAGVRLGSTGSAAPDIVAMLGQSNCPGNADEDNLSAGAYAAYAVPNTSIRLASFRATNDATPVTTFDVVQDLGPIESQATNNMGAELSLGPRLATVAPGRFSIAKYGVGATSLAVHWKPTGTYPASGGNLFTRSVAKMHAYESQLGGIVACIVWIQGESDAGVEAQANAYEANLTALIAAYRVVWPDVPFVILKLHTSNSGAFKETVRTAQVNVAAAVSGVTLVDSDSLLGLQKYNPPHYTANGYVDLGVMLGTGVMSAWGIG